VADCIKIYADENVSIAIVHGLRRRGVDILTTQEANMLSASDEEQLEFARNHMRAIFTKKRRLSSLAC